MNTIDTQGFRAEIYDSTFEFCSTIGSREVNAAFADKLHLHSDSSDCDFTKTNSFEEANDLMRDGYDAGCENLYNRINVNKTSERRVNDLYVVGHTPCVPAFMTGNPMCMYRTQNIQVPSKEISIVYDTGVSSGVSSENMLSAASKVLSVINHLERNNYRCNIYVLDGFWSRKPSNCLYSCLIKIKSAYEQMNLMSVAYPLTHPSFPRRHIYKWTETVPSLRNKRIADTYGLPISAEFYNINSQREFFIEHGVVSKDSAMLNYRTATRNSIDELVDIIKEQLR